MTEINFIPSGCNVSRPTHQGPPEDETKVANLDFIITNEELVRWMTEGTNPHNTPRSDCG